MAPIEPHWVCETCQRTFAAQPIACECGARAFVAVELDVGGLGVGVLFGQSHPKHTDYSNTLNPMTQDAFRAHALKAIDMMRRSLAELPVMRLDARPIVSVKLYNELREAGIIDADGNIDWSKLDE